MSLVAIRATHVKIVHPMELLQSLLCVHTVLLCSLSSQGPGTALSGSFHSEHVTAGAHQARHCRGLEGIQDEGVLLPVALGVEVGLVQCTCRPAGQLLQGSECCT